MDDATGNGCQISNRLSARVIGKERKNCDGDDRLLVGYRGKWYDVTHFLDKHPGGDVIRHFVGRDATHVMDSMHKFNVVEHRRPGTTVTYNQHSVKFLVKGTSLLAFV